jgi:hypothetical protein
MLGLGDPTTPVCVRIPKYGHTWRKQKKKEETHNSKNCRISRGKTPKNIRVVSGSRGGASARFLHKQKETNKKTRWQSFREQLAAFKQQPPPFTSRAHHVQINNEKTKNQKPETKNFYSVLSEENNQENENHTTESKNGVFGATPGRALSPHFFGHTKKQKDYQNEQTPLLTQIYKPFSNETEIGGVFSEIFKRLTKTRRKNNKQPRFSFLRHL